MDLDIVIMDQRHQSSTGASSPIRKAAEQAVFAHVPAYDAEVLGGDTCDLGQCCINPCGYLVKLLQVCFQRRFQGSRMANFLSDRTPHEIVYALVCYGGWAIIFLQVYPLWRDNPNVALFHKNIGYVVFAACVLSWRIAARTCPGNITKESIGKFDNYQYDNVLYMANKICPTLNIRKLPRSKYNRYTNTHVPRFDHHCHALNQSVGEENYRFFLLFLAVHTGMCWYGAIILCRLLWGEVLRHPGDMALKASSLSIATVLRRLVALACVNLFLTVFLMFLLAASIMLSGFLAFHCYIISRGMTTNEFYKWRDKSKEHKDSITNYHEAMAKSTAGRIEGDKKDEEAAQPLGTVIHPGEMAANLYDLGIPGNFIEVFYPRSQQSRQKTS